MHLSTMVTRTAAGSAELAAPAHGLSLTQRRFLTLLDTSVTIEELVARQPSSFDKLERDLLRLASLGLVVCEMPAANDPVADVPSGRLGAWRRRRRAALVLAPLALAPLVIGAWQTLSRPPDPKVPASVPTPPQSVPTAEELPATVTPIATTVLRGDPAAPGVSRDSGRDAAAKAGPRAAKPTRSDPVTTAPEETVVVPPALPVERRSPPAPVANADGIGAQRGGDTLSLPAPAMPRN